MNHSIPTTNTSSTGVLSDGADHLAGRIERNLQDVQQIAAEAMQTLTRGVDDLRATSSDALSKASAETEDLTRCGMARAREAVTHARDSATHLRDDTARRVQADPMKALLIAAAAGAASAVVVQWLSRSRYPG